MTYGDMYQQTAQQNPQMWGGLNPQQLGQTHGQQFGSLGQGGIGQPFGQAAYGGQMFGQPNIGGFGQGWMQPRQLSQHDVGEIVRQLVPLLPQVLAQTQQPQTIGYGAYGQMPRLLTQQDVNEVVRQILPIVPQIVAALQGQTPWQTAAAYGGWGQQFGQTGYGQGQGMQGPYGHLGYGQGLSQQHWQQQPWQQQPFGQFGTPQLFAAFGGQGGGQSQRQLTQQDVNDVVRQLIGVIPQVMGNLQAYSQQRTIN